MNAPAVVRPPFPYFGGKQRIASRIVALFPEHGHYVEPYCGGLSVFAAKAPSRLETLNDLDGHVMTFWRVLRDCPEELIRACALTPHSRIELEDARERDIEDELEVARRLWVTLSQGRNGHLRRTGWRTLIAPAKGVSFGMPGYLDSYVDRMAAMAERLHGVSLECRPALDVIETYGKRGPEILLYVDPPYLGSTRAHGGQYRYEMRDEVDHVALCEALRNVSATVVLSGYHSPLYDELYAGWHVTTMRATSGQVHGTGDHTRTEVLWSNRPLGGAA